MSRQWPSPGDYSIAIQNPQNCFDEVELRQGKVPTDHLGRPLVASGNFAVVYQLATSTKTFAVRCFSRPVTDQQKRYAELSRHFSGFWLQALVGFAYLPEGIRVRGNRYPLVRMEWICGQQMHRFVGSRLKQRDDLKQLAAEWRGVIAGLQGAHSAHGDLQHGNVLVDRAGRIRLVDYDGFFIPALRGHPPGEVGHPNYQHPERIEYGYYEENADAFSALVVYLSLLALKADPGLWSFHNGENLIFVADDFKGPGQSPIWARLKTSPDQEVRRLAGELEAFCRDSVSGLPRFEDVLQGLPRKTALLGASVGKTTPSPGVLGVAQPLVQRFDQIRSLVAVALADGGLSPEEEQRIKQAAVNLKVPTDDVDKIIREELRKLPGGGPALTSRKPQLEISKTEFKFHNLRLDATAKGTFVISNTGGGVLQGQISANRRWLRVLQDHIDTGRHRQDIGFEVNTIGLSLGLREIGVIEIRSNGGVAQIQVDLSVEGAEAQDRKRFEKARRRSGWALAIGIVAIGFPFPCAPLALWLGVSSRRELVDLGRTEGRGMANWAIGLGAYGTLVLLLWLGLAVTQKQRGSISQTAAPLQLGTFTTASAVTAWKDYSLKNQFRPGEQVCVYAEALNVGNGQRIDLLYEFRVLAPNNTQLWFRNPQHARNTREPSFAAWECFALPGNALPGSYTATVQIRNNLTGQSGTRSTTFSVAPSSAQVIEARPSPETTIFDLMHGASIGDAHGIRWVDALGGRGAVFSSQSSSRIEYPNGIPVEGTLEFWIKIDSGYRFNDYRFMPNQDSAMVFSTDVQGGDVTWPGTTKLSVAGNGDIMFWMATHKYNQPPSPSLEARGTTFRFGKWHALGVSYGSEGQYIMLDGEVVASAPDWQQRMGRAGNHEMPLDIPTIGETVSHYWPLRQHSGGFEGVVAAFRASSRQRDWFLALGIRE